MATAEEIDKNGGELIQAAFKGDLDAVKSILKACPDCINERTTEGDTALMWAVFKGHNEILKELVNAGVKLDEVDRYGDTALVSAAYNRKTEILRTLLAAGADIPGGDHEGTALEAIKNQGHTECIKLLEAAEKGIRPTCEEVGILPPKERYIRREEYWQSQINAAANEKNSDGWEIT